MERLDLRRHRCELLDGHAAGGSRWRSWSPRSGCSRPRHSDSHLSPTAIPAVDHDRGRLAPHRARGSRSRRCRSPTAGTPSLPVLDEPVVARAEAPSAASGWCCSRAGTCQQPSAPCVTVPGTRGPSGWRPRRVRQRLRAAPLVLVHAWPGRERVGRRVELSTRSSRKRRRASSSDDLPWRRAVEREPVQAQRRGARSRRARRPTRPTSPPTASQDVPVAARRWRSRARGPRRAGPSPRRRRTRPSVRTRRGRPQNAAGTVRLSRRRPPRRSAWRRRRGAGCTTTSTSPTSLTGSSSPLTLRRSTSTPFWAWSASATSAAVTEPKSLPPSPARAGISSRIPEIVPAVAWAASRSRASRAARLRRIDSAWATTPLVAFIARPAGHEVVAGVAVGHVDHVALAAQVLHVVTQHDLHSVASALVAAAVDVDARSPRRPSRRRRSRRPPPPGVRTLRWRLGCATVTVAPLVAALAAVRDLTDAVGQQRHLAGPRGWPGPPRAAAGCRCR